MALSADGGLLYALRVKDLGNGEDAYGVAVFDTNANKFLPDAVSAATLRQSFAGASSQTERYPSYVGVTREIRIARFDNKGSNDAAAVGISFWPKREFPRLKW